MPGSCSLLRASNCSRTYCSSPSRRDRRVRCGHPGHVRLPCSQHRSGTPAGAARPAGATCRTAVSDGRDFAIDRAILGAGFRASAGIGALLTTALAVEYLFVGLSLSSTMTGIASRLKVLLVPVILAFLTVAGTVLGAVLLQGASPALLAGVLAFGAVAVMT